MHRTQGKHVAVRRRSIKASRATVAAAVAGLVGSMGITAIAVAPASAAVVRPFTLNYDQDVFGDFLEAGNGNSRCPTAGVDPVDPANGTPIADCATAQARTNTAATGTNDSFYMRWADVDASAATYNSSTATLTIPTGATVDYARLNWAGDTGTIRLADGTISPTPGCNTRQFSAGGGTAVLPSGTPESTSVRLTVGAGATTTVAPQVISRDALASVPASQPQFYAAYANVTNRFAGVPTGSPVQLTLGNVWTPEGFGCFSGWSLVVVYKYDTPNPAAPLKRSVQIFDGHVRQSSVDPATTVTIAGLRAATSNVRVGLTAYEGDFNIAGDRFAINATPVVEPLAGGVDTNFFVSNAENTVNPSVLNNMSVDAKEFTTSLIPSGANTADLTFSTSGDTYLAQNLVLSVPISTLEMTKVPNVTTARPGDTITYTITASNPSPGDLNSVLVSDPAFPQCDQNIGTLVAGGFVTYTCDVTAGPGDLSNTATGTGTDTFGDPVSDTVTAPTVDVINPAIDVTKALAAGQSPPYQSGEVVTFALSVRNSGDDPLTNVQVTDAVVPACDRTFPSLAAGATQSWTCTTVAPVPGRVNTANAVGTDSLGATVTDTASVTVPNAGSISGSVFDDRDGDGSQGPSENPIGAVTITLTGTDENGAAVNRTTTTAPDGTWTFDELVAGTYTVVETQPVGYGDGTDTAGTVGATVTANDTIEVVLADAAASSNNRFAETTGTLAGSVYSDADASGTRDGGELGITGVPVILEGTTARGDALSLTTNSQADGSYLFVGVPAGTYTVRQPGQPAGYLDGQETVGSTGGTLTPPDSITSITLAVDEDATGYDFGEVVASSLSGTVTSDQGTALADVTITLTGTDDLGIPVNVVTTTNGSGAWSFTGLRPGTYTVTETQPAGYGTGSSTLGTEGGSATPNVISGIVLDPGTVGTGYGFVDTTGSLAGSVYADADADGVRDAGETGISGVTVTLTGTDDAGDPVNLTATTDGSGNYLFDALLSGTYTVTETQPAGYLDGQEAAGSAGGTLVAPDAITVITLDPEEDAIGYTFGELSPAGISGTVVDDLSRGIADVTVTLTGTDELGDPVTVVTTTDGTGAWAFLGLRPGTYTVTETQPAGYGTGSSTAGTAGGTTAPDVISAIDLDPGTNATGYRFVDTTGSLAGAVYVDVDGDGTRDAGEPGIGGVQVVLTGTAGAADGLTATVTTAPDGSWSAAGLLGGTWEIAETQPALWGDGDDTAGTLGGTPDGADTIEGVVLPDGGSGTGYLFGEVGAGLSGTVYTDQDGDGALDAGEPGIGGVTVTVTGVDDDGAAITPRTATTAPDGTWTVPGLPAGTYTVTETQPTGYADGDDTVGSAGGTAVGPDSVTGVVLGAAEVADGYDFGERLDAITGTVFTDTDRDGVRDTGETGIGGVTVTLLDAGGATVATTTTATDGTYEFADLAPGDYTVVEGQPTGYGSSTPNSVDVTVTGTTGAVVDFGDTLGTIGDRVWSDTDRDGVQDAGEPGIGGITVELLGAGGVVVATTTTATDGSYSFAVVAGTYQVRVVLACCNTVTRPDRGGDDARDSDVVQATLTTAPVTLTVSAGGAVQDIDTVDAGVVAAERDLAVVVTPDRGSAEVGDTITWTVVVTNEGTVPEDGAVVLITLPAGVTLDDAVGDGWDCVADGREVLCGTDEVVPPGEQLPPLQLVTTVDTGGDKTVEVEVAPTDGSTDAVPANDVASALVEVPADRTPGGGVGSGGVGNGGSLPRTGTDLAPWLGTATLLMALGSAMVLGSRRRRLVPVPAGRHRGGDDLAA